MTKLIPVWWTVVAGLIAALVSTVATSYAAGRQLAVLDRINPALEQLGRHETALAVVQATCCGEKLSAVKLDHALCIEVADAGVVVNRVTQ